LQLIIQSNGNISLKEITEKTFYSERHLNRLSNHYLGFNLKDFSRIVRINKAIYLLHHTSHSLDYISAESGFYDISHFIRDFRAVCGVTPQEYRNNLSDFYSAIAKF
jgi:AraC-like DNA-binding protein